MEFFKYKTIGNVYPQGKPKVYFSSHPDDFGRYFESVCNDMFSFSNCSIWYLENQDTDFELYCESLKQMHLIVIPITTQLLTTENKTIHQEFKYAIENNIPILPLMMEEGLEELFNKVCGELQFLEYRKKDNTGISYKDKLKKYLERVLIKDDVMEKIRSAFDAYVFLSYRKKDRKYADELMRLVHKNPLCRDIAIWYDEFLVPGENFNDAIKLALQKSDIFVLTLTPNVVNEQNYIINVEYPLAKKENKPIIPIELVEIDKNKTKEVFEDIPLIISVNDEQKLYESFIELVKKIAITSNDSPLHNYFIGLAYLSGIDVEIDHQKGFEMIYDSASKGLIEAIDKLIDMYLNGIGTKRSFEHAMIWQKKKIELFETNKLEHIKELLESYIECGDYYFEMLNNESVKYYLKAEELALSNTDNQEKLILIYSKLGDFYKNEYNLNIALDFYKKSYEYTIKYCPFDQDKISDSYYKLAKGYSSLENYEKSIEYYEKALVIKEKIYKETSEDDIAQELSDVYLGIGFAYFSIGEIDKAEIYYSKGRSLSAKLCWKPNGIEYASTNINAEILLARLYVFKGEKTRAQAKFEYARMMCNGVLQNKGILSYSLQLISALQGLRAMTSDKNKAKEYLLDAIKIGEYLEKTCDTLKVHRKLHECYITIMRYYDDVDTCLRYHILAKKLLQKMIDSVGENEILEEQILNKEAIGHLQFKNRRFNNALKTYIDTEKIYSRLIIKSPSIINYYSYSIGLGYIAETYYQLNDDQNCLNYYLKQYEIMKNIYSTSDSMNYKKALASICKKISYMYFIKNDDINSIKYMEEAINILEEVVNLLNNKENREELSKGYSLLLKRYEKWSKLDKIEPLKIKIKENDNIYKFFMENKDFENIKAMEDAITRIYLKGELNKAFDTYKQLIFMLVSMNNFFEMKLNKVLYRYLINLNDIYKEINQIDEDSIYKKCADLCLVNLFDPFVEKVLTIIYFEVSLLLIKNNIRKEETESAIELMENCIKINKAFDIDDTNLLRLYNDNLLGVSFYFYEHKKDEAKAKSLGKEALIGFEKILIQEGKEEDYNNLVKANSLMGKYNTDNETYFLNQIEIHKQAHDKFNNESSHIKLADTYYRISSYFEYYKNDMTKCIKLLGKAISLMEEFILVYPYSKKSEKLFDYYEIISEKYSKIGNEELSNKYLEKLKNRVGD